MKKQGKKIKLSTARAVIATAGTVTLNNLIVIYFWLGNIGDRTSRVLDRGLC